MASAADHKPVLRPVEAFSIEQDGQQWIGLHDPSGFSPAQVALGPVAFFIMP